MSTSFNLSNAYQSMMFFEDVKSKALEKLIDFSKEHTNIARCIGLPLAFYSSLLDLAQAVSTIGELIIKGIANICGSAFLKECDFKKGVKQLFLQLPCHIIYKAIKWPLGTAFDLLSTPITMLICPTSTLETKKDETEKKNNLMRGAFDLMPDEVEEEADTTEVEEEADTTKTAAHFSMFQEEADITETAVLLFILITKEMYT